MNYHYVVSCLDEIYGTFTSAAAARRWAEDSLPEGSYRIHILSEPK